MKLTSEQIEIIEHKGSHAKVMAVAGSGKTTTMIERIIHLIKTGANPKRILVLMFNASASEEFSYKLQVRAEKEGITTLPEVRTFHAMAMKLCKYLTNQNILPNYRLEVKDWILQRIADNALSPHINDSKGKSKKEAQEDFYHFIDLVGSDIQSPREKLKDIPDILGIKMPDYYAEAYEVFEEERKRQGIRFFSDLIRDPVMAMLNNKDNIKYVENIYEHIILDEYQDINEVQQRMTKFIAGDKAEVMAVGDADQCIYEWRGARPEYIVELFEEDFPNAKKFLLSKTYRYGHELSLFVNNIITLNKNRDDKICVSHEVAGDTVVDMCIDDKTLKESPLVKSIREHKLNGGEYDEVAILLRKFSMSLIPELDLIKHQIPYVIVGADSVFKRNEIMAIEGLIHTINDSFDLIDESHRRKVIESFFKIPFCGIRTDEAEGFANNLINNFHDGKGIGDRITEILKNKVDNLSNKSFQSKKMRERYKAILNAKKNSKKVKTYRLVRDYIDEVNMYEYFEWASSTEAIAEEKAILVDEFIQYIKNNDKPISEFITEWVDMAYQSSDINNETNVKKVLLTSIHRSKGLEWPLVIIPDLSDEKFPGLKSEKLRMIEEAERRLFYVGATRAISKLVLLHPQDKVLKTWKRTKSQPFPFLTSFDASRYLFEGGLPEVKKVMKLISGDKTRIEVVDKSLYQRYFFKNDLMHLKIKDENDITLNMNELNKIKNHDK